MANSPRVTLPVSAINAAAQQDPAAVAHLAQAAERVRSAQLGSRSADLRGATEAYRAALARVEEHAVARLEATGRRVSATLRTRIRQTLAAAAANPRDRASLGQGRLSHELAPAGFDVFGPTTGALRLVPGARPTRPARSSAADAPGSRGAEDARRRRTRDQMRLRTAVTTARTTLRQLETRSRTLQRTAVRAAQAAATAQQRGETTRQAAEDAQAAVRRAQTELAAAEEALRAVEPRA